MVPTAARRAKPVQRNHSQGLQGNPDACRPRRGSAYSVIAWETGGNAGPVLTGQLQPTAAMTPRIGGSRAGEAPRPFFLPISSGRNGGARRVGGAGGASDRNPAKPPSKKRRVPRGEPPVIERRAESSRPTKKEVPNVQRATTGRPYGRLSHIPADHGRMISAPTDPEIDRPAPVGPIPRSTICFQ